MATDTGIVKIYDLKNGGAPLQCHRIDAREFLKNPRWSSVPAVPGEEPDGSGADDGEMMRLKELHFKTLQAMALKAEIPGCETMKKAELVKALYDRGLDTEEGFIEEEDDQ